jgi:hypothetical protein
MLKDFAFVKGMNHLYNHWKTKYTQMGHDVQFHYVSGTCMQPLPPPNLHAWSERMSVTLQAGLGSSIRYCRSSSTAPMLPSLRAHVRGTRGELNACGRCVRQRD